MMHSVKRMLKKIPLVRHAYARVRGWHDRYEGRTLFENNDAYVRALYRKGEGTVTLHTHDGLDIAIRQNLWGARIVREIFFERPYVQYVNLPPHPVIVDIGGYIGDFSLYAAKYLNARRVVVFEPTAENFALLKQNIENNGYGDRITAVTSRERLT
jgi:Met-10+ like-protein